MAILRSRTFHVLLVVCTAFITLNLVLLVFRQIKLERMVRGKGSILHERIFRELKQGQMGQNTIFLSSVQNHEDANVPAANDDIGPDNEGENTVDERFQTVAPFPCQDQGDKETVNDDDRVEKCNTPVVNDVAAGEDGLRGIPLCPLDPPGLEGPLEAQTEDVSPQFLQKHFPFMERGGRIRPKDCFSRERVAIIIPYRKRWLHLHIMLRNLVPVLNKQMVDATFIVIEQALPATFNRGALQNVGFLEALKLGQFDCFILHDVDLMPLDDRNFYRCGPNPRHFAVAMNKYNFRLQYKTYFGGVVGFCKHQYLKINGNSNLYFGWGGEDDDLYARIVNKSYTMARYDKKIARYYMIKHERDKGNEINFHRKAARLSMSRRMDVEGLNTTIYEVNSIRFLPLYTWINVTLDTKKLFETAPAYTKADMWRVSKALKDGSLQ